MFDEKYRRKCLETYREAKQFLLEQSKSQEQFLNYSRELFLHEGKFDENFSAVFNALMDVLDLAGELTHEKCARCSKRANNLKKEG